MNVNSALQYFLFLLVVAVLVRPLGGYLDRVLSRRKTMLDHLLAPCERWIYRLIGVDPAVNVDIHGTTESEGRIRWLPLAREALELKCQ
jgi:K+-transporting ATPase A subunit